MEKLLLILLLGIAACGSRKYEIYIDTSSSDGSKLGHYLHDGIMVKSNTYMFIFTNERTRTIDTTVVKIINK